jgi:hypothetical protein
MPDLPNLPLLFDRRKIETSLREAGQFTFFNLTSTDDNATATGNNQATAYPIRAANTFFSSVPAGTGCVLPQTSCPTPLDGLIVYITNGDPANTLLCYPHPNDPSNSINALAANAPVTLGPLSITPFITFTSLSEVIGGKWIADGIGTGAAGSIETIVSQGSISASTTNTQAAATPITQAMVQVNVTSANNAVALPKAVAGLQITVNVGTGNIAGNTPLNVYPQNGSGDTINGGAANAALAVTLPLAAPTIFFCFVSGAWTTK